MKNVRACLTAIAGLLLIALTTRGALPQPDLLMQIYFAGAQKISAEHNSTAFTNEFCSTEALTLRKQLADKLSVWLAGWLQANQNVTVPDGAARLRPLFDDLQKSEFLLEMRVAASGKPEMAVAIKLDAAHAQIWQAGLKPYFATASFKSTGAWLIFDSDPALMKLGDRLAQQTATPPVGWFDLDVNWPQLGKWYPSFKSLGLPETQFTVTAPDDNFRINGKFYFPENLALNLEPWCMPTNTIRTPFNSFTAVRGFASWFQSQVWAQSLQISPAPNQFFLWSLPQVPFRTFAAIPVSDAVSALAQAYDRLVPIFNLADGNAEVMEPITPVKTNNSVRFTGVPYAALNLQALKEPSGQFLYGEAFPNSPRSTPLPPELFHRLETKNLVYYHYEITADRIPQLLQISQLGLMLTRHKQLDSASVSYQWLQRVGASLSHTDTEITQSGPAEFTFARKAPGIFTATELFILANWFEAKNFPGMDLKMPPPPERYRQMQQQKFHLATPYPPPGR